MACALAAGLEVGAAAVRLCLSVGTSRKQAYYQPGLYRTATGTGRDAHFTLNMLLRVCMWKEPELEASAARLRHIVPE